MQRLQEGGYSLGELFIALVIISALSLGGVKVAQNIQKAEDEKSTSTSSEQREASEGEDVRWQFDMSSSQWIAQGGTPPACPSPVLSQSPVDLSLATGWLYPGQYRGFNYKPHGGLGFASHKAEDVTVYAPMDATLTGLVRYIEQGELQYKLSFENDCGINYYFDHIYALPAKLQAVAETTPPPKVDDTRSLPLTNTVEVKTGEVVATAVGHPKLYNIGMDFGITDYRSRNKISENSSWQSLHQEYKATEWYGRCWFDYLPAADSNRIKALTLINASNNVSDYCKAPGGTTLDRNAGKPTNG